MEAIVIFVIFIVFSILRTAAESVNKKPTPMPGRPVRKTTQPEGQDVQTPPYIGDLSYEQFQDMTENRTIEERTIEKRTMESAPRTFIKPTPPLAVEKLEPVAPPKKAGFLVDKKELVRGVVFSEILGPPRALKHFRSRK